MPNTDASYSEEVANYGTGEEVWTTRWVISGVPFISRDDALQHLIDNHEWTVTFAGEWLDKLPHKDAVR